MGLANRLPWWARLGGKLVLSRLPVPYRFWSRLGLFRHGDMNIPERALATFGSYFAKAQVARCFEPGFTSLELGPGDSVLAGLAARASGAASVWLVDAGAFADTDVKACQSMAELLRNDTTGLPDISGCKDIETVLRRCDISYLTDGVAALARIPTASVDFFWSQVVLEHVPAAEFDALLKELRRVVKEDAVGVHGVDFRDHIGGGLNSLRFGERLWESDWFRNSGFYTNRIRCRDMIRRFESAGFAVEVLGETPWPALPLSRDRMAPAFRGLADEELLIAEVELLVRPRT
jgi:SAM-dependent methyltransferase